MLMLTVVICMIAAVVCCYHKQGMHEDEFYSYYSSNRTTGLYVDGEVSRDAILDELTVLKGEGFNFPLVKEVQSWDVHPPLYYFVLHFVCSLYPEHFSMWQGLIINLVCFAICIFLMKRLGDILIPDAPLVSVMAALTWGLSAAALTGVVFIRMYMLLTVWVLAVTILHLSMDPGRPKFYIFLGILTFMGFMTHYYFFIWLFFLAVSWNLRELIVTKKIKTMILYGITMVVTFGLCYVFYPAFPAQMFKGQRGAQATGNFIDVANTWERLCFFAEKINRIGFGGILWILIIAIVLLMIACKIKSPDRDPKWGNIIVLTCALIGYFAVVSKTALLLGDSSIRYQMPVLGVMYICVFAYFWSLIGRLNPKPLVFMGIIAAALIILNLSSDVLSNISFLYPETKEHIQKISEYPGAEAVYVYPPGQSWTIWSQMSEMLEFDSILCIPSGEEDRINEISVRPLIIFCDVNADINNGNMLFNDKYCNVYLIEE